VIRSGGAPAVHCRCAPSGADYLQERKTKMTTTGRSLCALAALLALGAAGTALADSSTPITAELPKAPVSANVLTTCPDPAPFVTYSKGAMDFDQDFPAIEVVGTVKNIGGGTFKPANFHTEKAKLRGHWGSDPLATKSIQLQTMPGGSAVTIRLQLSPWSYANSLETKGVPQFTLSIETLTTGPGQDCHKGATNIVTISGPTAAQLAAMGFKL
jgi:hypothetical protein